MTTLNPLTLNNSGSLNLSAANINAGALTVSATGNINSNAVKTTNRTESDHTQSKGLWYNNNLSSSTDESLHQTKINTKSLNDQKKYWGGLFGGKSQVQNNRT